MTESDKKSNIFFIIIFSLLLVSIFATYYVYVVREDFQYFTEESEIPNQFDPNTYIN